MIPGNVARNLVRFAVELEMRGDIWDNCGQNIFPLMEPTGKVSNRAAIFLKKPAPTSMEDGIEIDMSDPPTPEQLNELIEARKATKP